MATQLAERRRRIDAGEASLGWKLGMGVPAAMEKLGTDAPLVGYLLAPARVESGATVSIGDWSNAKLEPEIAVHMGADLAGDASRADAEAAIAGIGAAIELVDLDAGESDPENILAADIYQRHVVLGPVLAGASPSEVIARSSRATPRRRPPRTPPRPPATRSTSCSTSPARWLTPARRSAPARSSSAAPSSRRSTSRLATRSRSHSTRSARSASRSPEPQGARKGARVPLWVTYPRG